ncbi:uncharacterized protein TNCV_2968301 [Trichonephila clavipes]|nr:uncharacterized protein TNCV_2968301 [Trichonephila clavipes]
MRANLHLRYKRSQIGMEETLHAELQKEHLVPKIKLGGGGATMMARSKKAFKKRKGKYYKRTINSKVNAEAGHAHDSSESCAKEKKIPNLNESVEFSSNFHEGTQIATINTEFVYAMRSIGIGAEAGRMFCGIMNLSQLPTRFSLYDKQILKASKLVYEDFIQNAAKKTIWDID